MPESTHATRTKPSASSCSDSIVANLEGMMQAGAGFRPSSDPDADDLAGARRRAEFRLHLDPRHRRTGANRAATGASGRATRTVPLRRPRTSAGSWETTPRRRRRCPTNALSCESGRMRSLGFLTVDLDCKLTHAGSRRLGRLRRRITTGKTRRPSGGATSRSGPPSRRSVRRRDRRRSGAPILELGCGTGRVAIPVAKTGATVIGIDRSESMLGARPDARAARAARRRA